MSFPALALAVEAAYAMEPLEDEEYALTWEDLGYTPNLHVTWALYRSAGAGLIFGVKEVRSGTFEELCLEWTR